MSKIFLFIPPVIAAFLPFLAFNFFDTPQSHGFISAEVLFLVAMVALPQRKLLYLEYGRGQKIVMLIR